MKFDDELDELIWSISLAVDEWLVFDLEQWVGTEVPLLNELPVGAEVSL